MEIETKRMEADGKPFKFKIKEDEKGENRALLPETLGNEINNIINKKIKGVDKHEMDNNDHNIPDDA